VYQRRARIAGGALATPPTAPLEWRMANRKTKVCHLPNGQEFIN